MLVYGYGHPYSIYPTPGGRTGELRVNPTSLSGVGGGNRELATMPATNVAVHPMGAYQNRFTGVANPTAQIVANPMAAPTNEPCSLARWIEDSQQEYSQQDTAEEAREGLRDDRDDTELSHGERKTRCRESPERR